MKNGGARLVLFSLLWIGLFSGVPASAQERPNLGEHKFWDRTNILLYSTTAAVATADFWTTRRAISRGASELNPLAEPFAGSDGAFAAYKLATLSGYVGLGYLFHRKGWHSLERAAPVVAIATDGTAAALNLRIAF